MQKKTSEKTGYVLLLISTILNIFVALTAIIRLVYTAIYFPKYYKSLDLDTIENLDLFNESIENFGLNNLYKLAMISFGVVALISVIYIIISLIRLKKTKLAWFFLISGIIFSILYSVFLAITGFNLLIFVALLAFIFMAVAGGFYVKSKGRKQNKPEAKYYYDVGKNMWLPKD